MVVKSKKEKDDEPKLLRHWTAGRGHLLGNHQTVHQTITNAVNPIIEVRSFP